MGCSATRFNRRQVLLSTALGAAGGLLGLNILKNRTHPRTETFIAQATAYTDDIASILIQSFNELGITPAEIKDKKILLKPNLVEVVKDAPHINTHPLVVRGAIEAFLSLGAAKVLVAEGQGHRLPQDESLHVSIVYSLELLPPPLKLSG